MDWLASTIYRMYDFFSQDVARRNAATATGHLMDRRQQRADVEGYLAEELDVRIPQTTAPHLSDHRPEVAARAREGRAG